jgi:hypothetical protein
MLEEKKHQKEKELMVIFLLLLIKISIVIITVVLSIIIIEVMGILMVKLILMDIHIKKLKRAILKIIDIIII